MGREHRVGQTADAGGAQRLAVLQSVIAPPDSRSSSAREPTTRVAAHAAHRHTGTGAPHERLRETAQSRALASQSENRFSPSSRGAHRTCALRRPSSFSTSSSAGRPWQSQPQRRGTWYPRIVW
jgi:hypothetical protein